MKLDFVTSVVFAVIFSSCSIFGGDSDQSQIVGEWEWLYSTGGLFPRTFSLVLQVILINSCNDCYNHRYIVQIDSNRYIIDIKRA